MGLQDQLRLEDDLVVHGATKYLKSVRDAEQGGRTSTTGYGQKLVSNMIEPVAKALDDFKNGGTRKFGKYRPVLNNLDSDVMAYIALKCVFDCLHIKNSVSAVCIRIGSFIEDESRFSSFKALNPEYYTTLIKDFKRKNTKSYRHMRNVLSITSQKKGFSWQGWDKETRLQVGALLLEIIMTYTEIIKISKVPKKASIIVPTEEACKWISEYNEYASLLHPYTKPCIIEPDDWTGLYSGGYWSEAMRQRNPFVKGLNTEAKKFTEDHDLSLPFSAVNKMQKTAWEVNTEVLEIIKFMWNSERPIGLPRKKPLDIPTKFKIDKHPNEMTESEKQEFALWKTEVANLHTEERSRAGKTYEAARVIAMAQSYANYEKFWFVYQCDFRGRIYASTSGINPQGSDFNKALLRFSDAKPIGEKGIYWLKVHGANTYGVDKVSFDERVKWVEEHHDQIVRTAESPTSYVEFWQEADKPYQFIAFCLEYFKCIQEGPEFLTRLPVGMDGSCNGLQNFSALLRDEVGGRATNLVPNDKPADIYYEVSRVAYKKLSELVPDPLQRAWMRFAKKHEGLPRKLSKRCVMTLPYGSTRYSCMNFVEEAIREIDPEFFSDINKAAAYMTPLIWDAIEETVVAARNTMEWLQEVAGRLSDQNLPVWWVSPAGFPVYQNNVQQTTHRVRTALSGSTRAYYKSDTKKMYKSKQKSGVSPNFVHSLDAAHLMLTIDHASQTTEINSFAMIHDDFGTLACDIDDLRESIRRSFVNMYKENEPLHELYIALALVTPTGTIPPVPDYGTLDLNNVLESEYFFA